MVYKLIARNLVHIFRYIQDRYSDLYKDETELLLLTGYLGAIAYLKKGQIVIQDIMEISHQSMHDVICIRDNNNGNCEMEIYENSETPDRLLTFIMNMIVLFTNVDQKRSQLEDIMLNTIKKKEKIQIILNKNKNAKVPKSYKKLVDNILPKIEIKKMRKIFKKIISEIEQ